MALNYDPAKYAASRIETYYLKHKETYLALEDLDFIWDKQDVAQFDHMWNEGLSIADMAVAFNRDGDEVAILAMDRIRKGKIQPRKGGAFGRRMHG